VGQPERGRYVPPEFTSRVNARVVVTDQSVTVMVFDDPPGGRPAACLWRRGFDRPPGKSERECVTAAVHALGSGLPGWIDLLDQDDQPLDELTW